MLHKTKGGYRSPHFLIEEKPSESATLLPGGGREFNYQKTYYAPNTMLHASRSAGTIISWVQMTQFPSSSQICVDKAST